MYKLNKKGFAVTTVVYSILVLLILFMFILLAIVRGSYFNEKDFTKEVQEELDTYLKNMGADTKKPICTFTGPDKNPIVGAMDVTYYHLNCTGENLEITTLTKDNFTVDSSGITVVSVTADASNSTTKLSFTLTVRGGTLKGVASTITLPANSIKITGGDGNDAVTSNSLTYAECKEGATTTIKTGVRWCSTQGTTVDCNTPRTCINGAWVDGDEDCDDC